jgi:hypothetical protein
MTAALCVITSCRLRGRHLPGCDADDCGGCLPRQATEGYCCDVCTDRTASQLTAIAELADDARAVARGEVRRGAGGASGKPGSQSPLNDGATDALDAVTNALTTIARDIAGTRGLQIPVDAATPTDPLARVCSWLSGQLAWARHATDDQGQPYAVAFFAEVADRAWRIRSLVNGREPGRYAGPCGYVDEDENLCGEDVEARPGASHATCRACGSRYDVEQRQAWMRHAIEDQLARPVEIARILLQLGFPIGYSTIAAYAAKGLIAAHGHDGQGRPRYRIGDVLATRINAENKTSRRRLHPSRDTANPVGG